ncbi:hypothetical protein GUITHDRAFT_146789 [Guillardia theta CCMP2712]|uniref:Uncharacterized protein n=1 Tax=Guillardia theta (strain CCMP2712) TaxID=905079 RepID=L1IFK0_GUITC|nr:hypothetical protein GUITHDRAFT_146789 [Guillardia theta CCMP2712]EKX35036.1 hypothetical protein GUITHDRAFT_146789 [Guillardia theta CCMP2712]|eukprot:XP_005822016.1 hypothetical protein GUITHDRAFT_146789 [Guillardia theta CCMP2712]
MDGDRFQDPNVTVANKFEEGKEFEAAAAERAKESQLSEATRRKLQRRSQILSAEVKSELSRAVAQLRHTSHHYKHVKNEIETALRHKDRKLAELSKAEGRIQGLEEQVNDQKKIIQELNKAKEDAHFQIQRMSLEVDNLRKAKEDLEGTISHLEEKNSHNELSYSKQTQESNNIMVHNTSLKSQLKDANNTINVLREENASLIKTRDHLMAQLKNSKEVVARITADNLMFLNKIKHSEAKVEQAVKEREVLRKELNENDGRWFEHLRDELQKVTQTHLDAIEESEQRMMAREEEDRKKLEEAEALLEAARAEGRRLEEERNSSREEAKTLSLKFSALSESHEALSSKKEELELQVASATSSAESMQKKMEELSKELEQRGTAAAELQELNEIVLREKQEEERKLYSLQADLDISLKRSRALEQDINSLKHEKDVLARQLSTLSQTSL